MHPDFLLLLARERHEDLLCQREFRELSQLSRRSGRAQGRAGRARARFGLLLVALGSRLADAGTPGMELIHE
jgi:hypothetical protein